MRLNCDISNEKLPFKCDKSISAATTNLQQQNPCMTSGIIFVTIPYCTIYYLLYRNSLLYEPNRKVSLDFSQYLLFLSLTVPAVIILLIVKLFLTILDIS